MCGGRRMKRSKPARPWSAPRRHPKPEVNCDTTPSSGSFRKLLFIDAALFFRSKVPLQLHPRLGGMPLLLGACRTAPSAPAPTTPRGSNRPLTLSLAQTTRAKRPRSSRSQMRAPSTNRRPYPSPDITSGVLENGLTYYIRPNPRPARRAALRLLVDVGSVLEEDDEQGFAHFVEHMAFNGTEKFAKNEIIHVLEKAGVKFGQHTNASTSFDQTAYELVVPTNEPGMLETGVEMLQQLAGGATFTPEDVEQERGVVIEEWRLGLNAQGRIRDKQIPVYFKGSRYADRLPIERNPSSQVPPPRR